MEGLDGLVATAAYQPEPTAAAAARRFVRDTLQAWFISGAATVGHGLVDDAVLLTSELVTNAVVHAGTPVEVTCKLTGGGVEVVVSDGHPARLVPEPPENEHIPAERTSGRGLLLPAALASAWGVTYGQAAKAVWFRLGEQESGLELEPGGEREDGLRPVLGTGIHTVPGRGPDGQPQLAAALSQTRAAPVRVGAGAPGTNGAHRWPVPPFGSPAMTNCWPAPWSRRARRWARTPPTPWSPTRTVSSGCGRHPAGSHRWPARLRRTAGRTPPDWRGTPGRPAGGPGRASGPGGTGRPGRAGGPDPAGRTQTADGPGWPGQPDQPGAGQAGQDGGAGQAGRAAGSARGERAWLAAVRAAAGAAPSVLTVPFVVDGRVTGMLAVESATVDRFHDNEATGCSTWLTGGGPGSSGRG